MSLPAEEFLNRVADLLHFEPGTCADCGQPMRLAHKRCYACEKARQLVGQATRRRAKSAARHGGSP